MAPGDAGAPTALGVLVFAGLVILAAALRLPALDVRPMHADEAVHAAKLARLLEQGVYRYDPSEYHGPTLYYLTLIPARARGMVRHADLDEITLRSVPAVVGVLLVAAHVLLVPIIGFRAAVLAALFAAVSPAMVFYSRYYIQETLLAAFGFGALLSACRYLRSPRAGWAVACGAFVGLMHATKETWVIGFGSMAGALGVAWLIEKRRLTTATPWRDRRTAVHLGGAAVAASLVSVLFFSSFLQHPRGILDSIAAYRTYAARAWGASWHVHPWHYYLGLLLPSSSPGAPVWTEAVIVGLALVGLGVAFGSRSRAGSERRLLRVLAAYAVLMAVAYSAIPYKTPWCVVSILGGLVLMAGVGSARLLEASARRSTSAVVAVCLAGAAAYLGWLAWSASVRFASDPRNPYVYAHTGADVFEIARRVEALAHAHPDRMAMPIEVVSGENLWPLPWYLRRFTAVRWERAPVNDGVHAPVVLATPEMEDAVRRKLYEWRRPGEREMYVPVFDREMELRPRVEVRGYAAKTLWDRYLQQ